MKFQWLGGPTFFLELGAFRILCDPVLGEGESAFVLDRHPSTGAPRAAIARLCALPPLDLSGIDCVVITRLRDDHFDGVAAEKLDKAISRISPATGAAALAESGASSVEALDWWQESRWTKGGESLSVLAVPAQGSDTPQPDEGAIPANGYIFEHNEGDVRYAVYWTGETVWFSQAREIKKRIGETHLLVPNLGAVGAGSSQGRSSLDGKEAMQFVFMFHPKMVIPIGHHTFSHYVESVDVFKTRISNTLYDRRLVLLKEGEVFEKHR
jgi:L-ascorbate metabolism protein UlaG (beta-lactamase superfamily)